MKLSMGMADPLFFDTGPHLDVSELFARSFRALRGAFPNIPKLLGSLQGPIETVVAPSVVIERRKGKIEADGEASEWLRTTERCTSAGGGRPGKRGPASTGPRGILTVRSGPW
jgi:hypothetical protein